MQMDDLFTMTTATMQQHNNQVKDIVVQALAKEGLITAEAGTEWMKTHGVMVIKRSWLTNLFRKKDGEGYSMKVVKLVIPFGEDSE